jgi:hypothetical protein
VLQGAGGGLMAPVGLAMLFRVFPPAERIRASTILTVPTTPALSIHDTDAAATMVRRRGRKAEPGGRMTAAPAAATAERGQPDPAG